MFPLSTVVFPHAELPLHVFEPRYQALIADALAGEGCFGTVLISAGSEVGGGDRRCDVGTLLRIEAILPLEDGRSMMLTRGVERFRVLEWLDDDPYPRARIEPFHSVERPSRELLSQAAAAVRRVRMLLSELDDGPCSPIAVDLCDNLEIDGWMVCALAPLGLFDLQRILEEPESAPRLERLIDRCCERIHDLEALLSQSD